MIKVEGLTRNYGSFTAVDDISFVCQPGTVTGFLGPNGAGKTTTMRVMVGLTPADARSTSRSAGTLYQRHPQPRPARRRPARRLGPARRPHRPRDPRASAPAPWGCRRRASTRCSTWSRSTRREAKRRRAQLLARHEAAARHRPRPARRPVRADPRRAGQRPRPGRHPLDARPAQGVRRPRRHRAALEPPAPRGRADRRRDDPDRPRPDRGAGHKRGAARATPTGGRRPRSSPRSTTTQLTDGADREGLHASTRPAPACGSTAEPVDVGRVAAEQQIVLTDLRAGRGRPRGPVPRAHRRHPARRVSGTRCRHERRDRAHDARRLADPAPSRSAGW